jgi:hypothetical protein
VLNSQFVSLLLHIIKSRPSKAQQQTSPRATTTSARSLAATALALFLRYATFIQPPAPAAQDSHILSVLVNVLSEPEANRVDALLRRRALAALGELIFYVSAQGEDEEGGEAHPWVLPPGAVMVLTKSLSDDSDEVVRHYAAKVRSGHLLEFYFRLIILVTDFLECMDDCFAIDYRERSGARCLCHSEEVWLLGHRLPPAGPLAAQSQRLHPGGSQHHRVADSPVSDVQIS